MADHIPIMIQHSPVMDRMPRLKTLQSQWISTCTLMQLICSSTNCCEQYQLCVYGQNACIDHWIFKAEQGVCLGESDPKHVFLLELVKKDDGDTLQRLTKHRLHSVRPFKFKSIVLSEQLGVYNSSEASVKECIRWEIESMVAECYRQNPEMLPLIRLRIDYTGYDCVRCHEIQKTFSDKVANPDTMLLWVKKTKRREWGNVVQECGLSEVFDRKQGQTEKRAQEATEPCLMDELIVAELEGNLKVLSVEGCTQAFRSVVLSNSTVIHCS